MMMKYPLTLARLVAEYISTTDTPPNCGPGPFSKSGSVMRIQPCTPHMEIFPRVSYIMGSSNLAQRAKGRSSYKRNNQQRAR